MEERGISDLSKSIVTGIGERPVVPDPRELVSRFEPGIYSHVIMSESTRVPNMFWTPVTLDNSLHSNCHRDVPTHLNEEFHHCWIFDSLVVTLRPF